MHCLSWGISRLGRRWLLGGLLLLATIAAVLLSLAAAPPSASAATDSTLAGATPTPAPSPTASAAFAITSPTSGDLITTSTVPVSGTGQPDHEVQVFYNGSEEPSCIAHVASDSTWTCPLPVDLLTDPNPSGPNRRIEARLSDESGTTSGTSITVDVIAPPTVLGPAQTNGQVKGSGGYPNATVTVTVQGGAANGRSCLVKADKNGNWACFLSLPTGAYSVSATQKASFAGSPSSPSPSLSLRVDADAPAAPVVTSPSNGSAQGGGSRVAFAGTGEDGASVSVYVRTKTSGSLPACTATVSGTTWACTSRALPAGNFVVSALQTDAVGNTSTASPDVSFMIGAAPSAPSAAPTPSSAGSPATPGAPPSQRPRVPSNPPSSPQSPSTGTPAPAPAPGGAPPPAAGPDGPGHWLTSAPFASTVAPTIDATAFPGWLRSLLLAIVAVLLLALPARLLAGTLSRAPAAAPRARVFGRNRPAPAADDPDETAPPRRWLVGATLLLATAAIVTLSSPATNQSAYVRLLTAATVAVALVNAVWALIGIRAGRHFAGAALSLVFAPRALVIVAACALVSRFTGLSPALLFGLAVGVAAGEGTSALNRGRLAAMQIAGLSALGVLAWMVTGALPPVTGPFTAFAAETTNAVAIVAVGSAAVSLLPLGRLAGRTVFAWSRPIWLGLSLAVGTVFFALLVPVGDLWSAGGGGALLAVAGLGFAALSVAVWLWVRYIEPVR